MPHFVQTIRLGVFPCSELEERNTPKRPILAVVCPPYHLAWLNSIDLVQHKEGTLPLVDPSEGLY